MNAVEVTKRVMRVIDAKAASAAKLATADVLAYLDGNPNADAEGAIELFASLRLIERAESLSIEIVRDVLSMAHPDEPERVNRMRVAGINREQDYIWARVGAAEIRRMANGGVHPDDMMRINGVEKILRLPPEQQPEA